jgi:hypothetical protein
VLVDAHQLVKLNKTDHVGPSARRVSDIPLLTTDDLCIEHKVRVCGHPLRLADLAHGCAGTLFDRYTICPKIHPRIGMTDCFEMIDGNVRRGYDCGKVFSVIKSVIICKAIAFSDLRTMD